MGPRGPISKWMLPWPGKDTDFSSFLSIGDVPNTVLESTVSSAELGEFVGPRRGLGRALSEFLSPYYLCAKANSRSFSQNSPSLPQNSVSSLL